MVDKYESLPQTDNEMERLVRVNKLVGDYFPEDIKFILENMGDEEDIFGFLYGQLIEIGEDPDEILAQYGIIES